jgi:hypothetical protein
MRLVQELKQQALKYGLTWTQHGSTMFGDDPKRAQDGPTRPHDGLEMPQDGPTMAQHSLKMAQDDPEMARDCPVWAPDKPTIGENAAYAFYHKGHCLKRSGASRYAKVGSKKTKDEAKTAVD